MYINVKPSLQSLLDKCAQGQSLTAHDKQSMAYAMLVENGLISSDGRLLEVPDDRYLVSDEQMAAVEAEYDRRQAAFDAHEDSYR